ncbi:MAG: hypothetical protein QNJ98_03460 [Planctomycetota bacterium]|nr:hypothetical protein [Planctomycetota bacterium]
MLWIILAIIVVMTLAQVQRQINVNRLGQRGERLEDVRRRARRRK